MKVFQFHIEVPVNLFWCAVQNFKQNKQMQLKSLQKKCRPKLRCFSGFPSPAHKRLPMAAAPVQLMRIGGYRTSTVTSDAVARSCEQTSCSVCDLEYKLLHYCQRGIKLQCYSLQLLFASIWSFFFSHAFHLDLKFTGITHGNWEGKRKCRIFFQHFCK